MNAEQYRHLYLERLVASPAPATGLGAILAPRHWYAPRPGPAENLALRDLFELGVLRGHGESRDHLRRRLDEADRSFAAIAGLNARLRDRDRDLRDFRLAHDKHVHHLEQAVAAARAHALDLEQSTFWRLTGPLRWSVHRFKLSGRWIRGGAVRARHVAPRVAIAWRILRDEGPAALARRLGQRWGEQQNVAGQLVARGVLEKAIAPLEIPVSDSPRVSVIVPTYGQDLYTFTCLKAVAREADRVALEVIVMDDAAPVPASQALACVRGARFERNERNLGFLGNCNRGVALARGEFVLLLNNDAVMGEGSLAAMLDVFEKQRDAGAVGAKLVFPDGRLQEAGGIVWRDGTAWNYGRDDDPAKPEYNYLREVDYCSGACLLLRREDFLARGGFDGRFAPAYYEDTDLCFQIRATGHKVYYQPRAEVVHFEGRTHGTSEGEGLKRHQVENRSRFYDKWRNALAAHRANGLLPRLERDRRAKRRVLFVEARMLTPDEDSGSVRTWRLLAVLRALGCKVTFAGDNLQYLEPHATALTQEGVELLHHPQVDSIVSYLEAHGRDFDVVVLARYYVAANYIDAVRRYAPRALLVLDTIDLHFLRTRRQAEIEDSRALARTAQTIHAQETGCIHRCDVTWVVSQVEKEVLARETPGSRVIVLSNIHQLSQDVAPFATREGIVFVGGYRHPPNIDAAKFYAREVMPHLRRLLPGVRTYLLGSRPTKAVFDLAGEGIEVVGFVPEIEPWLRRARVSVSPLRYGAGVKGKINQSMSLGLPVVATAISVEGMHVAPGEEVLVEDQPQAFAEAIARLYRDEALWNRLSAAGRESVERHFSPEVAARAVEETFALIRS